MAQDEMVAAISIDSALDVIFLSKSCSVCTQKDTLLKEGRIDPGCQK